MFSTGLHSRDRHHVAPLAGGDVRDGGSAVGVIDAALHPGDAGFAEIRQHEVGEHVPRCRALRVRAVVPRENFASESLAFENLASEGISPCAVLRKR